MHSVTAAALLDELQKIAEEGSLVGRLVNADVAKNQFPDSDVGGGIPRRQHQGRPDSSTTTSSPDPEVRTPEGGVSSGGFTY